MGIAPKYQKIQRIAGTDRCFIDAKNTLNDLAAKLRKVGAVVELQTVNRMIAHVGTLHQKVLDELNRTGERDEDGLFVEQPIPYSVVEPPKDGKR